MHNLATTIGGLIPTVAIFSALSYVITLNFKGLNRLLLFVTLTTAAVMYVEKDVTNNIRMTIITMAILAILSLIAYFTKKE